MSVVLGERTFHGSSSANVSSHLLPGNKKKKETRGESKTKRRYAGGLSDGE